MIKIISGLLIPKAGHRASGEAVISLIDGQLLSSEDAEFHQRISQGPDAFVGMPNVNLGVQRATWIDTFSSDGWPLDFDSTYTRKFSLGDDILQENGDAVAYRVSWAATPEGTALREISVLVMGFGVRAEAGRSKLRHGLIEALAMKARGETRGKRA